MEEKFNILNRKFELYNSYVATERPDIAKRLKNEIIVILSNQVEPPVKPEIADIDNYLRTVTTFMVISKSLIKEEINNVIDKKFMFIENDIKKANDAIDKIKKQFSV